MENLKTIACIYHANCNDGLAAAACVKIALPDQVDFYGLSYIPDEQEKMLSMLMQSQYKRLIFVDITLPLKMLMILSKAGKEIQVFDHHDDDMRREIFYALGDGFDRASWGATIPVFIFDPNHSGCYLTYRAFINRKVTNYPIILIEDRDIWKWEFNKDTNNFHLALSMHPRTIEVFEYWIKIYDSYDYNPRELKELLAIGATLAAYENQIKTNIKSHAYTLHPNVVMVNCPEQFQSAIGNELTTPDNVICLFVITEKEVKLSFRSKNGKAIKYAKLFNGGGHPDAAGAFYPGPFQVIGSRLIDFTNYIGANE